jgi:hypothetical protein
VKKVLMVLICVLLLVGCGKKDEETKKEDKSTFSAEVTVRDREVEIGTKIDNLDAVKVEKGKLISKKEDLDTSKIGVQNIKVTVEDENGNKKDYEYTVTVIDKRKPTITYSKKLTTTQGTKINLLNGVSVKDDSMEELKVNVEGEYDFNKVGTYTLYYVAEDSSGNKAREEFTLTVKEKPAPAPTPSNTANNVCEPVQDGTFTTSNGHSGVTKNGITYIDGFMIANKTYSLPSSYGPGGLTGETNAAANEMFAAAKAAGYNMWAQSGFRSYDTQKRLYNNYVSQRGKSAADTFSARPGHSEHQTGLAFDVCATGKACINSGFDNTPEAKWLSENAYKYGFILRYPSGKTNETGYKYESWHFRYVGVELATKLYNGGNWITLEDYFGITSQYSC